LYSKIADGLPQHKKAPTALFMIGFVQENDLGDISKAKTTYESFLQKYPNDPDFADDAQNAIKMLGKSPDDIIKEFEKQGKQQTQ
jgi:TolA-binding protein